MSNASAGEEEEIQNHELDMNRMVQVAQVCHFCTVFRQPLKLPAFTRQELQQALIEASNDRTSSNALLAELHFKLAREQPGVKLEKMIQDWERVIARKLAENWRTEFLSNPMQDTPYCDLSVDQRVRILDALCHWKIETCNEIRKYIADTQKENDTKTFAQLRGEVLGSDDSGVIYWYFNEGCWVYAEEKPEWQLKELKPCYQVEYASAKRIRLSINFNPDPIRDEECFDVKKEARKESTDTPSHDTNEDVEIKKDEEVVVEKEEVEDKKDEAAGSPVVSDSDSATGESVENESPKEEENNDDFDEYEMIPQSDGITEGDIIEKRNEREIRNSSDKSVSGTKKRFIIDDDSSESDGEMNSTKPKKIKTDDVAEPLEKKSKPTITAPFSSSYQPDDDFDINCASCKKSYDMRYLDPPLTVRPSGEWRCFECLVNDARGWPRRRKSPSSSSQGKQKEEQEETSDNKRSSRRKFISSPSKKTSSRSSSSKTTSSSSKSSNNKGKSSKSKSKSKSSGSKSTFSKTRSSSSSSSKKKKHKKKKSSSSSSSSRHKSRRHHHDYAGLVSAYQSRFRERSEIQAYRETCEYEIPDLVGPRQWRVVASNTDTLRSLIKSLEGGSLGQERLRGRLIMILKEQEKIEQKMLKQQALAWQILPRRQSSRIAIEKLKYQASGEPNSDDDETATRGGRQSSRLTRSAEAKNDGYDSKEQLALERASRARRRQRYTYNSDENDDDDEDQNEIDVTGWIDWSNVKLDDNASHNAVCKAIVTRLLEEEIADLFSRPVDPELDGCPDYLDVVTHPMDLGTIQKRVESGFYQSWKMFKMDVERVWHNCRSYNSKDSIVVQYAETLQITGDRMIKEAEKKGLSIIKSNDTDNDDDAVSSSAESRASGEESSSAASDSANSEESDDEPRQKDPSRLSRTKPSSQKNSSPTKRLRLKKKDEWDSDAVSEDNSSIDSTDDSEKEEDIAERRRQKQRAHVGGVSNLSVLRRMNNDASNDSKSPPPPPPPCQVPQVQARRKNRLQLSSTSSSESESGASASESSSSEDEKYHLPPPPPVSEESEKLQALRGAFSISASSSLLNPQSPSSSSSYFSSSDSE